MFKIHSYIIKYKLVLQVVTNSGYFANKISDVLKYNANRKAEC